MSSGNMNVIGLRADPDTTITATMPTTATSITTGSSARINGTGLGSGASGGASGRMSPGRGSGPGIRVGRPDSGAPDAAGAVAPASAVVKRERASPIVVALPRVTPAAVGWTRRRA